MRTWAITTKLLLILFSISLGCFAQDAYAQSAPSKGSGGRLEGFMSAGYVGISTSASEFDVAPGLQLVPFARFPWLQIGGEITYQKLGFRGGSASNLMLLGGPTINLNPVSLTDSFFVSLGVAYRSGSADVADETSVDPNGIGFYFFAGKRFPISGGFTLRPSMGVIACGTTGMVFRPFAVSYLF